MGDSILREIYGKPLLVRLAFFFGAAVVFGGTIWIVLVIKNTCASQGWFGVNSPALGVDGLISIFLIGVPLMRYYDQIFAALCARATRKENDDAR